MHQKSHSLAVEYSVAVVIGPVAFAFGSVASDSVAFDFVAFDFVAFGFVASDFVAFASFAVDVASINSIFK